MKYKLSTIIKLKIIYMLLGMMFWYGIEQLFMNNVLKDPNARAWTTAVWTGTLLIFDIPGGIIADKYGRRKTLLVGMVLQFIGVALLAMSHTTPVYLLGAFFFALHWSLGNGAVQALLYDHLITIDRHREYAKHQGSVYAWGFVGAAVANSLSGIIAHVTTLRTPYILSLFPIVGAFLLTCSINEQALVHTIGAANKIPTTIRSYAFALRDTIQRTPILALYAIQYILAIFVSMTILEFGQVFLLSYGITTMQLGLLWALDAIIVAVGLQLAYKVQRWPQQTIIGFVLVLVLFSAIDNSLGIILFMIVYMATQIVSNVTETEIQHKTASNVRATMFSSVSFIGNLLALPCIWLFNWILQTYNIHAANRVTALGIAALCVSIIFALQLKRKQA